MSPFGIEAVYLLYLLMKLYFIILLLYIFCLVYIAKQNHRNVKRPFQGVPQHRRVRNVRVCLEK